MVDLLDEEKRENLRAGAHEAYLAQMREATRVGNATRYTREICDLASALASLNEFTVDRGDWPEIERQKSAIVKRLNILLGIESE